MRTSTFGALPNDHRCGGVDVECEDAPMSTPGSSQIGRGGILIFEARFSNNRRVCRLLGCCLHFDVWCLCPRNEIDQSETHAAGVALDRGRVATRDFNHFN